MVHFSFSSFSLAVSSSNHNEEEINLSLAFCAPLLVTLIHSYVGQLSREAACRRAAGIICTACAGVRVPLDDLLAHLHHSSTISAVCSFVCLTRFRHVFVVRVVVVVLVVDVLVVVFVIVIVVIVVMPNWTER